MELVELVENYKDILTKKHGKQANLKKQKVWKNIHKTLIDRNKILPTRHWTDIRQFWYRYVSTAKRNYKKFVHGMILELSPFDKRIMAIVNNNEQNLQNYEHQEEFDEHSELIIERTEHIPPSQEASMLSDEDLKRKTLEQKYKMNQLTLTMMRHDIYTIKNPDLKRECLELMS